MTQQTYIPEIWQVKKDTVYAAITAVDFGLEYARECLADHDMLNGRMIHRHKRWAETMESHIQQMERTLKELRECGPDSAPFENQPQSA